MMMTMMSIIIYDRDLDDDDDEDDDNVVFCSMLCSFLFTVHSQKVP